MPTTPKNACSMLCKKGQRPFQRKGKIPIVEEECYIILNFKLGWMQSDE